MGELLDEGVTPMMSRHVLKIAAVVFATVLSIGCTGAGPAPPGSCVVALGSSPARGPADAWVTIVEFADFQCSYCGKVEPTVQQLDEQRPGLRWVFKHFPLTNAHPQALPAALAADCANEQGKFWEMHDLLFANQSRLGESAYVSYAETLELDVAVWNACRKSEAANARIADDFDFGISIGVDATPTFFFNGEVLSGAAPLSDFLEMADSAASVAKKSGLARADYYAAMEGKGCSVK